ncbi:MAG: metabolite traffic protein EboE, partial [Bacteroidota bacterium]
MQTPFGQLTYCSNIHTGEDWQHHFSVLQENIPLIKKNICPDKPFGIGLRLANQASIDLSEPQNLQNFQQWLTDNDCYVFTMNGFPYGGFHDVVVKDNVHAPDWTSTERVDYTIRMFRLLAQILPNQLTEGGISTSPLSYRFWWKDEQSLANAVQIATQNMLLVVDELVKIAEETGKILHLDIEPEPDGILENSVEFIDWYQNVLIPSAIEHFAKKSISAKSAQEIINTHIQLCYDICHFGVSYEEPQPAIDQLNSLGIKVGKIQISSAIKVDFTTDAAAKLKAIAQYDEPTYLHQVVALRADGKFDKYPDLKQAIDSFEDG